MHRTWLAAWHNRNVEKLEAHRGAPNDSSWFVVVPFAQIAVRGVRVHLDRRACCVQQRAAAVPVGRPSDGPGPMPGLGRSRFLRATGARPVRRRGLRHRDDIDRQRQLHARVCLPQGPIGPSKPRLRRSALGGGACATRRQIQQQAQQVRLAAGRRLLKDRLQLFAHGVVLHADVYGDFLLRETLR